MAGSSTDPLVIEMEVEKHERVSWVWLQCQKETNYRKEVEGSFPVPSSPSGFFLKPALRLRSHLPNLVKERGRGCQIETHLFKNIEMSVYRRERYLVIALLCAGHGGSLALLYTYG